MANSRAHRIKGHHGRPLLLSLSRGVRREDGFTLIEVVMAMFIFGLVITGVVMGMSTSLNLTRQNRSRSIAANLASQEMDTVRSTDFMDLPMGTLTSTQTIDGVPYTVTRRTGWQYTDTTAGPCQAPSGSRLQGLWVETKVSWTDMRGVTPPVSNTVVTPPVGTYDPSSGHVAVTVKNAAGQPQADVPVTLTGGSVNESQTTGPDGCAFFAYEPAGTYTVALNRAQFVSDQGVASPSASAAVVTGSTVQLQFQYDRAATITATLSAGGAGLPTGGNIPVSLGNTHILPSGTKTVDRQRHHAHDRFAVPVRRWVRPLGGRVFRRRPRRDQAHGRRLLRRREPNRTGRGHGGRHERRDGHASGGHRADPNVGRGGPREHRRDRHSRGAVGGDRGSGLSVG